MAYNPNNPNGQATMANSTPVAIASNQSNLNVALTTPVELAGSQTDIHGQALAVSRITQVTAKFFQQSPANFLNISAAGGATATGPVSGLGVFATGTAITASLLAQTPTTVMYSTGYEAWASQAAVFTTPTSAASFQRIGIYDSINGYFFGFSGLTFGVTIRSNSVDVFIPKTSWNTDALIGAVGSKFTSNGVPVALVATNINMYRVRYGWYGAVTARLEVYSPDGSWVLVHVVRTANTQASANITNPDLPMTVEVSKTASDTTDVKILCGGWASGVTAPAAGPLLSGQGLIAALNAVVAIPLTGLAALSFSITGTWVGTLSFQYSLDGLAWSADFPLNNLIGVFRSTATANGVFTSAVGSHKFYRIIATAWTSGSASIVYNGSSLSSFVVAQSFITDGTNNGPAAVKPASTAALAIDTALVVALHPTSPLPSFASTPTFNSGLNTPHILATGTMVATSTANAYTVNNPNSGASCSFVVTGLTASGATLAIETSNDNGVSYSVANAAFTNGTLATTVSVDGQFRVNSAARTQIRLRVSITGTGVISAASVLSAATGLVALSASIPAGSNLVGSVTLANGQTAHSTASTGSPVRIAGRVKTTVDTTLVAGRASDLATTTDQSLIIRAFAAPELDWSFASNAGGVINTTDVVLVAAAGASIRRYIASITIQNASATIATEVVLKDGTAIIWRGYVGTQSMLNSVVGITFAIPLKTTANTALNFACITTGSQVYVNAQGFNAS